MIFLLFYFDLYGLNISNNCENNVIISCFNRVQGEINHTKKQKTKNKRRGKGQWNCANWINRMHCSFTHSHFLTSNNCEYIVTIYCFNRVQQAILTKKNKKKGPAKQCHLNKPNARLLYSFTLFTYRNLNLNQ